MTTYHALHFDPTVDEIETLKQLEMGQVITAPCAQGPCIQPPAGMGLHHQGLGW